MNGQRSLPSLMAVALCLAALSLTSLAGASDRDKRPLFNTFYLPAAGGAYTLSLGQDRTFRLTGPCHTVVTGTFNASDREIGLLSGAAVRHFAYCFDGGGNLVLSPTKKDAPCQEDILASMAPVGRGNSATFIAACNYSAPVRGPQAWAPPVHHAPVVAVPVRGVPDRRDYGRDGQRGHGHDYERGNGYGHGNGQAFGHGRWETRCERVLVEAAHYETRHVPAVYETRRGWRGSYQVVVQPACHERVLLPARYEDRNTRVWVAFK